MPKYGASNVITLESTPKTKAIDQRIG